MLSGYAGPGWVWSKAIETTCETGRYVIAMATGGNHWVVLVFKKVRII